MISQAECRSHAALCKQLAKEEPTNRFVWSAEAEYWLRLSKERIRGEARTNITFGTLASSTATSDCLSIPRWQTFDGRAAGETNACTHAALPPAALFVHLTGFVTSVRSLIAKRLRRDRCEPSASHRSMQRSSIKNGRSPRMFEEFPENAIWCADPSAIYLVAPGRAKNQTVKATEAKSAQFLAEFG